MTTRTIKDVVRRQISLPCKIILDPLSILNTTKVNHLQLQVSCLRMNLSLYKSILDPLGIINITRVNHLQLQVSCLCMNLSLYKSMQCHLNLTIAMSPLFSHQ